MSHFEIRTIPGRVVLVHDMSDCAVISELEIDQATLLLRHLDDAVRQSRASQAAMLP